MPQQATSTNQHIDLLKRRIDNCTDIIKQLTGTTPDAFTFTFAVRSRPIVVFDIDESAGDFVVSFFMAWHQRYSRVLKDLQSQAANNEL